MSCCGNKRAALTAARSRRWERAPQDPLPSTPDAPGGARDGSPGATLLYLGPPGLALRGPRTGRVYHCDFAESPLEVDPADTDALLATGLFAFPAV